MAPASGFAVLRRLPCTPSPCGRSSSDHSLSSSSSSIARLCCVRKHADPRALRVFVRACSPQSPRSGGAFVTRRWNSAVAAASFDVSGTSDIRAKSAEKEAGAKENGAESAENFIGVLRDTTEQLKEQAEKARAAFSATAQETAEKGKENLSYIAENAPDPIKDIAETALKAHSPDNPKKGAKIHDFCLGIPYGSFLVIGGILWFIISGSTAAIRFGVILGGILLALSVSSLKVWKKGESSIPYIKGQAAITLIILLRELRRFSQVKAAFPTAFAAVISTAMLGFYSYVYFSGGNPPKKSKPVTAA